MNFKAFSLFTSENVNARIALPRAVHYAHVAWRRIVLPRVWRFFILPRLRKVATNNIITQDHINSLFFNNKELSHNLQPLTELLTEHTIFEQAEEAKRHIFAIFSYELREHGDTIDWHKDYASGRRWNATEDASRLDFMASLVLQGKPSDVKYVWDLNRCHWFTWLGMAYMLDNNEQWAEAWKRDILSWQAANPLGKGINWAMPMEVAIRATNWIFSASFFCSSPSLDRAFWQDFLRCLWQHGKFLEYNCEYVRHNANHFLSNAMGLLVIGAFFLAQGHQDSPALSTDGKRWFRRGKQWMESEILRQFTADGINFEKSTSYHRFSAEMCSLAAAAAYRVHDQMQSVYYEQLTKILSYIFAYSRPDGSAPRFGDTDNGRVLRYTAREDFNNHLKNIALEYFFVGNALPALDATLHPQTKHSPSTFFARHFEGGNYVIWRDATLHFMADIGDYGMNGWGGHGHNDCLSFELWAGGESICIDSGTGCYTSNPVLRNELRSTKAHNTVMVENAEQTEYVGLWRIKRDELFPRVLCYEADEHSLFLVAEHSGYYSRFGVRHRRTFRLQRFSQYTPEGKTAHLTILDELLHRHWAKENIQQETVQGTVQFILPTEAQIEIHNNSPIAHTLTAHIGERVRVEFRNTAGWRAEPCRISLFYGDVRAGHRITSPCASSLVSKTEISMFI